MPDWLIWVAIAAVLSGCGRGCGWGVRRNRGRPREAAEAGRVGGPGARRGLTRGVEENAMARAREPIGRPAVSRPVETPLQALQSKFVNGAITLEQYEAEIDKLEHLV